MAERHRVSWSRIATVAAELALTAGALVLLFLGWQLWWNDALVAGNQTASAQALSRDWGPGTTVGTAIGDPVVVPEPAHGAVIGVLHVPAFGGDYVRTIAQGTTTDVLNSASLGVGHYDGTAMPGGIGNFAVAGHRSAYGGGGAPHGPPGGGGPGGGGGPRRG